MTFLAIAVGATIGTFLGNSLLFFAIGQQAKKVEKQQKEELEKLQNDFLAMHDRERERMEAYAKLEG